MGTWRALGALEASLALQDLLGSQDFLVSQGVLESTAPMLQDLQACLACLGGMGLLAFPGPRGPQVLLAKMAHQERQARKEALVMWAPQDPRESRETRALSGHLERMVRWDLVGQLDLKDPQGLPGHQDQDMLLDSMTWKALEHSSGQQPEALMDFRDLQAYQDSRGILE